MPKINPDKSEFTFAPIGVDGSFRCSDSRYAGTLAEFLSLHDLTIDDDTEFARIKRYEGNRLHAYEYRSSAMKVRIVIYNTKIY